MTWVFGVGILMGLAGVFAAISTDIGEIRRAAQAGEHPRRRDRGERPNLRLVHSAQPGATVIAFPARPEPSDDVPHFPDAA